MSLQARYSSRRSSGVNEPGRLDRRVQLQSRTATQGGSGEEADGWTTFATVWASKHPMSSQRFFAAESKHAENLVRYRIRYRSDVRPLMRLVHGSASFEILGIDEAGRQHMLDLACRAVDQALVVTGP